MYTEFYHLLERPFELAPDPRYLYLSAQHREALAHLTYGVQERKGFVQLTGEVGTGKTTMLDALAGGLDVTTKVARLSHTTIDELDLLRVLGREFGIEFPSDSKADMLARIGERLAAWTAEGENAVFIVDEAQNLSLAVLEEIRLLSNLRAGETPTLQIVLAGQPELREKLELSELRQLRQRIGIRYHLTPLSREEARDYVEHRLAVAGAGGRLFDRGALDAIYEYSQGVPRVINTACDRALLAGYADNVARIGRKLILEAVDAIEGREPEPAIVTAAIDTGHHRRPDRTRHVSWVLPVVLVVGVLVVAGGLFLSGGKWRQMVFGWTGVVGTVESPSDADRSFAGTAGAPDDRAGEPLALGEPYAGAMPADAESSSMPGDTAGELGQPPEQPRAPEGDLELAGPPQFPTAAPAPGAQADLGGKAAGPAVEVGPVGGPGGPYAVVVASSRNQDAARREAQSLKEHGIEAGIFPIELSESGLWFRVVVDGGYPTLEAARAAIDRLQASGYDGAWVWRR